MKLEDFCYQAPKVRYIPEYDVSISEEYRHIKALTLDGANCKGLSTKVFAYIGFPECANHKRVPAVVLVHGGGGHAFPEWIRLWNNFGFAAIAMETTGYFPREEKKGLLFTENHTMKEDYVYGPYGIFCEDNYTSGPDNSRMCDFSLPPEEQWMYHAIADTILSHNVLLADSRIDKEKIGIVGISWGGVITSLAIGYDTRYAFAVPIYGCGHLDALPAPKLPRVFCQEPVKTLWSAADRFERVTFPVMWKSWLYDSAFSVLSENLSYKDTRKNGSLLSLNVRMNHSHIDGWKNPDAYRFAKCAVEGKPSHIKPCEVTIKDNRVLFKAESPDDLSDITANLYYITVPLEYGEDSRPTCEWQCVPATFDGCVGECEIPNGAKVLLINFTGHSNGTEYTSSSEIFTL